MFWIHFEGRDNRIYGWIGSRLLETKIKDDNNIFGLNNWQGKGAINRWSRMEQYCDWSRFGMCDWVAVLGQGIRSSLLN